MMWALILIVTSIWDGRAVDTKFVGFYSSKESCELSAKEMSFPKYQCVLKPIKESANENR